MISRITPLQIDIEPQVHPSSPRSPRNKIQRKPDILRPKPYENKDKKLKSNPNEFLGFYSPKHQPNIQSALDAYQLNSLENMRGRTLKNQRSLTHLRKGECSITRVDHNQNKNKENSISNSSDRSMNSRRISRLQLELKALTYENTRLKAENKLLTEENQSLKTQITQFAQTMGIKPFALLKHTPKLEPNQKITKLVSTIQALETELKVAKQKLFQSESLKQSKHNLQAYIGSLEAINTEQRQQLFKLDKSNKYLQIQLRTLKKQRMTSESNKKLHNEYLQIDAENKKLRKMVIDLQTRLKNTMIFQLTPDVSESESFLLD